MLNELRDGHTNLTATFNTSYYRKWWSDYPENYSARLVEEHYLNFNYLSTSGIDYAILPENIGYMRYGSFGYTIGEGNLDQILFYLNSCDALIIDIRDNGGGNMTNVETLVRRFITERTLVSYISHKTYPGHKDFSKPYAYYFDPAESGRIMWGKPIAVLTSRGDLQRSQQLRLDNEAAAPRHNDRLNHRRRKRNAVQLGTALRLGRKILGLLGT